MMFEVALQQSGSSANPFAGVHFAICQAGFRARLLLKLSPNSRTRQRGGNFRVICLRKNDREMLECLIAPFSPEARRNITVEFEVLSPARDIGRNSLYQIGSVET